MHSTGIQEIVPLPETDCFAFKTTILSQLDISLHFHSEFELNLMENGAGARRIIGYNLEEITAKGLILIGSGLKHGWQTHNLKSKEIKATTLHFHANLFSEEFLKRCQVKNIRSLLADASRGISFSPQTIAKISPLLRSLQNKSGFESLLLLMQILHVLSTAPRVTILPIEMHQENSRLNEDRIKNVLDYVYGNINGSISLKQAAGIANMTEGSFSRFFKQRTGKTFVECVNEIRIDHASQMLADTSKNIAEIAFSTGFNNISNFNRIFKFNKNLTPTQYREVFAENNFYKMCS